MVKAGYKQTEVGVIPEDWDVKKLREFAYPCNVVHHLTRMGATYQEICRCHGSIQQSKMDYHETYLMIEEVRIFTVGRSGASFGISSLLCEKNLLAAQQSVLICNSIFNKTIPRFISFYFLQL